MPLPSGLGQYEFQRELVPSTDLSRYHHLRILTDEAGVPLLHEDKLPHPAAVDVEAWFGRPGPIELEIGCGKGNFLVEYCEKFPGKPFVGLEKESDIAFLAARRLAKRPKLEHARVVLGDAYFFMRDFLADSCVDRFHMYFPDPWPKKRHHKKRLMREDFLQQMRRVAEPGALFHFGTDHEEYRKASLELVERISWLEILQADAGPTEGIFTNFEKKWIAQGKPIYRSVMRVSK